MKSDIIRDSFGWDVFNWQRAVPFWEEHLDFSLESPLHGLEIGARFGGLSLYLASKGVKMICSNLEQPEEETKAIHKKHAVSHLIEYRAIDATAIPFENKFDLVCFKSVLGGIGRNGRDDLMKEAIRQIHTSLKPDGHLIFAENLRGSKIHQFARRKFVKWESEWNYLKMSELNTLFKDFSGFHYRTFGFLGALGRSEMQKKLVGTMDLGINKLIPDNSKYIVFGIAKK